MAKRRSTPSKQAQLSLKMREILGNAYAFVRGAQYTQTIANITYEELLDRAIGRIEGTKGQSEVRTTRLARVRKIKEEIGKAVTTVKSKPPSFWKIENDSRVDKKDAQNTKE